ncbi:MAG: lycopene cyclase family protein [Actinobacteria bacterium]|nr:lycopene cyclase family protein [Actinomycetota bacterium]
MTVPAADRFDVVVLGAGPGGAAITHSLIRRGLTVALVDPRLGESWGQTLGSWVDDLDPCDDAIVLKGLARATWQTVRVVGEREHELRRSYLIFDNSALQSHLVGIGFRPIAERAVSVVDRVDADGYQREVGLESGSSLAARVVIDAGGSSSGFLLRQRHRSTGVQSAYGVVTRRTGLVPAGTFTLMDWSQTRSTKAAPTFLYGMDFGDGTTMVEETSLVERSPRSARELRELLHARLGSDVSSDAIDYEDVHIEMGGAPPSPSTRVVGFGAAGGFIHPVTGYSVAASLRAAPRLAETIVTGISTDLSSDDLTSRAWSTVWSPALLRTRALHDYGLATLGRLGTKEIQVFFDAFFSLPEDDWSSYLRIDTPPMSIARTMTRLFLSLPRSLQLKVASTNPSALFRLR